MTNHGNDDDQSPAVDSATAQPPETVADSQADIVYNEHGLAPAIVQDVESREVLMMAWVTPETLQMSLDEGRTVFWSRSRNEIWRKGETSGNHQLLRAVRYDCDGDVLLFEVEQVGGGACHTGEYSCFHRSIVRS